jgi:hypothetical protein
MAQHLLLEYTRKPSPCQAPVRRCLLLRTLSTFEYRENFPGNIAVVVMLYIIYIYYYYIFKTLHNTTLVQNPESEAGPSGGEGDSLCRGLEAKCRGC